MPSLSSCALQRTVGRSLHDPILRLGDRLFVRSDNRETESLVELDVAVRECLEKARRTDLVGFRQRCSDEPSTHPLTLRTRRDADDGEVPSRTAYDRSRP